MNLNGGICVLKTKSVYNHQELVRITAKKYLGKNYATWVDDITQDVMLKALTNGNKFDEKRGNLESWLYTMTKNLCFDLMEKKANSLRNITIDGNFVSFGYDNYSADNREMKRSIRLGLERLSKLDRSLLIMKFYFDLSGREIANMLNIPENQIPARMMRAKTRLRNILDPKMD
jgi:RNA polymerase sigma-70 factor (ECF subfamily)